MWSISPTQKEAEYIPASFLLIFPIYLLRELYPDFLLRLVYTPALILLGIHL